MIDINILIAITLFIFALIITYKKLTYGFFLYILLVPLMHKEVFSLGYWDVLPIRVAAGGIAVAAIVLFIQWFRKTALDKRKQEIIKFVKHDYFLVLLIILWLIRAVSLLQISSAIYSLSLSLFFTSILFMYVLFKVLLQRHGEEWYKKVLALYLLVGGFTAIFAFVQYYMRISYRKSIGGVWVVPGYQPRLGSTFWDVNHYGGFLITLIPLLFALTFALNKKAHKIIVLTGAGVLSFLLFMTQSRSSWIGLAVGLILSVIIYYWSQLKKPLFFGLIAMFAGIVLLFGYTSYKEISIKEKVGRFMHARLDSTDTHLMLLEGAAEVFVNNLVIGAGYGNFDEAFRETETATDYFDREPKLRDMKVPPHSVWGETLAETGGPGIVIYVLFSILLIATLITAVFKSQKKEEKYVGVGFIGGVTAVFTAGLFYSYNIEFYWAYVFLTIGFITLVLKDKLRLKYILKWWYDKPVTPYLIIIPPALFFVFLRLGTNSLIDWDEAIYAKVAKNILDTGDWLTLYWKDLDKFWFEKPPLYMWLTAITYKIVGINALGARLVSAVFGFLGIILAYKFGEKLYNKLTGILAALILLSTVHYLYYARNGMLDVTVTFFITISIYLFYLGINKYLQKSKSDSNDISDKKVITYFALSGAAIGLAVMTKAVIGMLPFAIITFFLIYMRFGLKKSLPIKKLLMIPLIAALIILPWHLYSIVNYGGEFIGDYLLEHILGRGLSGLGHEKPVWWFLEVIKVSMRIWVIPFILGIFALFFIDKKKKSEFVLLLISALTVLVFFSISKDKLQWYIIPIYPFAALIAARTIDRIIVLANSVLKKEVTIDHKILRVTVIFVLFLTAVFYIILLRDRVYLPDHNKDKVALVKIHNQEYDLEHHPDRKLYYSRTPTPTLIFYSNHEIRNIESSENVLRRIDESDPDRNNVFLLTEDMFYAVNGKDAMISAPLVLEIKGAAGGWILVKALSRVEILNRRFNELALAISPLNQKKILGTLTPEEKIRIDILQTEMDEVGDQLIEYGQFPYGLK